MQKRNLFAELSQGFGELKQEREGKVTLKQVTAKILPPVELSAQELVAIRGSLQLSQAVFAPRLRVSPRTLAGWERGRKVNSTAATLIKLVDKDPEVLELMQVL
ncbi:MAG: helix-turn-helix domain-containing protein [Cycloclasticus sp.]|jgi:Predicted transcriptional regulator